MYKHPYTVSNKLKEIKISIYQIHLATLSIDELDIRDVGKKDSLNRESLHIIEARYLGDEDDNLYRAKEQRNTTVQTEHIVSSMNETATP